MLISSLMMAVAATLVLVVLTWKVRAAGAWWAALAGQRTEDELAGLFVFIPARRLLLVTLLLAAGVTATALLLRAPLPLTVLLAGAALGWIIAGLFISRPRGNIEYQRAVRLLRKNDYAEAVRVMDNVIRDEPDNPQHYRFRAEILRVWGKLDRATPKYIIESDATIVAPLMFAHILGW